MSKFKFLRNESNRVGNPRKYSIASGTAVKMGEVVKLVNGLVVPVGDVDSDDPYLGVSAEKHDGVTNDGRQTGTEILIYDDPGDVFALPPSLVITATGGTNNTFVDANLLPAVDGIFNGGAIKIKTCAADNTLVGRVVKITTSVGATGTLNLAESLPVAFQAGDTACLCPGERAKGQYGWDLSAGGDDINFESAGGESLICVGADLVNFEAHFKFRLHQKGNNVNAL